MEKKKTALTEENPGGDSRYSASDAVHQAGQQAQSHAESKPVYSSAWQQRLDQAMEKILNREPFQYDLNGDALYRRYRDQAVKDGRMAMLDTMGQASAMTGGYSSSYAQSAGQQSYQQRLDALADRVPELYAAARERAVAAAVARCAALTVQQKQQRRKPVRLHWEEAFDAVKNARRFTAYLENLE